MAISEMKMQMVMANYFKSECDTNTSIRQAFEKGFRIGVEKGASMNRPQGKWIEDPEGNWDDVDRGEYECSSCRFRMYPYISDEEFREKYSYCPNCGAEMKGAGNETAT